MFCYQCKDSSGGLGCVVKGRCGKETDCSVLQDLLVQMVLGIGVYASRANELDLFDSDVNDFIHQALIATMTGMNHDPQNIFNLIQQAVQIRSLAKTLYEIACAQARIEPYTLTGNWDIEPSENIEVAKEQAWNFAIPLRRLRDGEVTIDLQELILYGLKGVVKTLRKTKCLLRNYRLEAKINEILDFLAFCPDDKQQLRNMALKTGTLYQEVLNLQRNENRPLPKRFADIMSQDSLATCTVIRISGEEELPEALRFVKAYRSRWLKDCEQKSVTEWSAQRIEPFGLEIEFFWHDQESISFYLAVKSMGIDSIHLYPQPAFLKLDRIVSKEKSPVCTRSLASMKN